MQHFALWYLPDHPLPLLPLPRGDRIHVACHPDSPRLCPADATMLVSSSAGVAPAHTAPLHLTPPLQRCVVVSDVCRTRAAHEQSLGQLSLQKALAWQHSVSTSPAPPARACPAPAVSICPTSMAMNCCSTHPHNRLTQQRARLCCCKPRQGTDACRDRRGCRSHALRWRSWCSLPAGTVRATPGHRLSM